MLVGIGALATAATGVSTEKSDVHADVMMRNRLFIATLGHEQISRNVGKILKLE